MVLRDASASKNHLQNKLRIFLEPTLTLVERQLSTGLNLLHLFNYFSFYQFLFIIYFLSFHYFYSLLDGSSHPVFTYITPSTQEYFWWRDIYHQYPCHLIFYQHFFLSTLALIWLKPWWQNIARSLRWNQVPTDRKKIVCTVC